MAYKLMLKEIRENKGITQPEMSDLLDMNLATYRSWERGRSRFTLENACRCAEILGCTPNDLCNWYEDHPRAVDGSTALPPSDLRLVERYHSLSEGGRETVDAVMEVQASLGENEVQTGLMEA